MTKNNLLFSINIPLADGEKEREEKKDVSQQYTIRSKCWTCHTSRSSFTNGLESMDLTVSISHQQSSNQHCLCDIQDPLDYIPLRIFCGPKGSEAVVMETPFQLQRALLQEQGFQVHIEPSLVKCSDYYNFHVVIGDAQSIYFSGQTTPKHSEYPEQMITYSLTQSQIPLTSVHILKELLEQSRNGDIQMSFCNSNMSTGQSTDYALPVHSCILRTVGSTPMEKVLSTSLVIDSRPTVIPVREIRFKDSSSAAVEAVVRFIYLGQIPILEPLCGYTVKDLMSLASYLGIEFLQDYCVDLVLGKTLVNHSTSRSSNFKAGQGVKNAVDQPKSQVNDAIENHKIVFGAHQELNQIGAEIILQVLFSWGHRFPKIRHAIMQALISDYGYGIRGGKMMELERFKDHEGFDGILCEMMSMMRQI